MEFSKHAVTRLRQRGFQELDLFLIANLGIAIKRPGNLTEYQMTQKVIKQIIQSLDRVVHKAILMDEIEGKIVTAYNLNNR